MDNNKRRPGVVNSRIFWEFPTYTRKLKGNKYYKDFNAYLVKLKSILDLFFIA